MLDITTSLCDNLVVPGLRGCRTFSSILNNRYCVTHNDVLTRSLSLSLLLPTVVEKRRHSGFSTVGTSIYGKLEFLPGIAFIVKCERNDVQIELINLRQIHDHVQISKFYNNNIIFFHAHFHSYLPSWPTKVPEIADPKIAYLFLNKFILHFIVNTKIIY